MIQWIFLLIVVVGLIVLFFLHRNQSKKVEGFGAFKDESMRFANAENNYFQNVAGKALFVNPGLTYSNLNDALASPDLYVAKTVKKDYTPYLMVDPESAFSSKDREFCRGAVHPRNLPARKPGSAIGCGWYFVEDPDTASVGVLGTVDGPSFSDLPGGGVWMWDVIKAGELEDIKACKRVTSCDVIDVEGVKGACGFCATNGYAVPINGSGQVKYPESEEGSCGEPTKNSKAACEVPIVQGYMTEDGVDCGTAGRPSPDMSLRLYTKAECDTLGGIHNPDGQCLRSDGGSFSSDCKELNVPPAPPPSVCKPDARGNLSKDCLKGIALSLGYSKQGGVMRQLMMPKVALGATDMDAFNILQKAGIQVPESILGTGSITKEGAGALYKKLSDAAFNGASNQIKQAAKWFTVGTTEFDICDYKTTQRGPFGTTCLQRAFRTKGCQASGSEYPSEKTTPEYANMTWGELNSKFTDLFKTMNSSDPDVQDTATEKCLGLTHTRKPPRNCDFDFINEPNAPTKTWNELNQMCEAKGQRLCNSKELCPSGKPNPKLNVFNGQDNWMAVSDEPNQWLTYATFDNRLCKTHSQAGYGLPGWGNTKDSYNFYRAGKCCPAKCKAPFANPPDEVSGWQYKGCFKDCSQGRGLPNYLGQVSSIAECIAKAKARGFNTSGNQYFGQCWAGNNTDWNKMGDAGCCEPLGGGCTQQIYTNPVSWVETAVKGAWFVDPNPGARLKTIGISDSNFFIGTNTVDGIYGNRNPTSGSYWQYNGLLKQVDTKGEKLIVGIGNNSDGYIYQWVNNDWLWIGVRAKWVSIGTDGTIVCVNKDDGTCWRYLGTPQKWEKIPGICVQISVGNRDTMWCITSNDQIYRWNGSNWDNIPGGLTRVAVSGGGKVAGVNRAGNIFVYSDSIRDWRMVPGGLTEISISETYMAGISVSPDSRIYFLKI